jgi:hypothetical protein
METYRSGAAGDIALTLRLDAALVVGILLSVLAIKMYKKGVKLP